MTLRPIAQLASRQLLMMPMLHTCDDQLYEDGYELGFLEVHVAMTNAPVKPSVLLVSLTGTPLKSLVALD